MDIVSIWTASVVSFITHPAPINIQYSIVSALSMRTSDLNDDDPTFIWKPLKLTVPMGTLPT
jgi:hypothetical protein